MQRDCIPHVKKLLAHKGQNRLVFYTEINSETLFETMMKICKRCRKELDSLMFTSSTRTKDGFQLYCMICAEKNRISAKNRYDRDPKYRDEKVKSQLEKYHNDPEFKKRQNKTRVKNQLKQYINDPQYRVHLNISSQIRQSLKNGKENQSWEVLVGFTINDLMLHLESQFEEGMNWDNYGDWHIDHRVPKSWFEFNSVQDKKFKECWELSNLKPMWGKENISKGNRFSD